MNPRLCKACQQQIREVCSHLQCLMAYKRGFCTIECLKHYFEVKVA